MKKNSVNWTEIKIAILETYAKQLLKVKLH